MILRSSDTAVGPWTRERLLVLLAGLAVAGLFLLTGLGLVVWEAVTGDPQPATTVPAPAGPEVGNGTLRDRVADAPMSAVDPQAAFSPDPALTAAGTLQVPAATDGRGPAGVPSGFPHTPEGAVGQWAAIEQTVLEAMSLPIARDIHAAWVLPGGPTFDAWDLTRDVRSFLASGRQAGQAKDVTTLVTARPAAGVVKGTDGPDWVVGCVLLDVQVAIRTDSRMGYGLCSRLQWADGRWQVAAGPAPAPAPSAWPGSVAAVAAGWLSWHEVAGVQR